MFESKKRIKERLTESFGKVKEDSIYFESVEKYFRNRDHSDAFQVLSDKTCNDLDFNELFMFLDRTSSKVGQQFLYNILRTIPSEDKFNQQEEHIKRVLRDPEVRLKLQIQLDRLSDENAYFITSLFQDEHIRKPNWFFVVPLLSFTSLLSILLTPFTPQFFFLFLIVVLINMGIHYWNKRNLNEYIGSIPQLLKLNSVAKEILKLNLFETTSGLSDSIKIIDKVRRRMSFFKLEAKLSSDVGVAFWAGLELVKTVFLLEPLLLFGVLKATRFQKKGD